MTTPLNHTRPAPADADDVLDTLDALDAAEAPTPPPAGRTAQTTRTFVRLMDGTEFTVRVSFRDRIQWDMVAPRKKWGRAQDVPFLAQSFVTWVAAKREQATTLTWEQFSEVVDDIEQLDEDESDTVHPTNPGAGRGRS